MPIDVEKRGRVVCFTLNRPEAMNAMDAEMTRALEEALIAFRDDPELWVGIIRGAGERAFCAGADLRTAAPTWVGTSAPRPRHFVTTLELWKPLIAAINGYCLAGGLGLALFCDVRLASERATFATMGTQRGIVPGIGQTQRLPRSVPLARALEMLFWGDRVDAQEALRIGLVNRVVPHEELMPAAWKWAEELCLRAPLAVRAIKEAVVRGMGLPLEAAFRVEMAYGDQVRQTEDAQEGIRAFNEKRQPRFQGR